MDYYSYTHNLQGLPWLNFVARDSKFCTKNVQIHLLTMIIICGDDMEAGTENDQSDMEREKLTQRKRSKNDQSIKEKAKSWEDYCDSRPDLRNSNLFEEDGTLRKQVIEDLNKPKKISFLIRFRPYFMVLAVMLTAVSMLTVFKPLAYYIIAENKWAFATGFSGVGLLLSVAVTYGLSVENQKTFVDIDEKLYSSRVESAELERDEALRQLQRMRIQLDELVSGKLEDAEDFQEFAEIEGYKSNYHLLRMAQENQGFDQYLKSIIRSLDKNIELADNKASLLLDKGTTYLWRGILFYVLSIVVWQVATAYFKVGEYAIWGMVSCSMTFLVVEFLAAWFLRQYKSFTDSSFNLVRVKSVFNRYFLSYLAIKEFSDSSQHLVDMRLQMLKVLEEDIKWLDPALQKGGDLNHMVAMFESVSGLVEKLKVPSKTNDAAAS